MIALHSLAHWSIVTVCPLAHTGTIVLDLHNVIPPEWISQYNNQTTVGVDSNTHCTYALYPQTSSDKDHRDTCEKATADAAWDSIHSIRLETGDHQDTKFKVLDRNVTPQISIPQICLPRNQVSQLPNRASCTVAIAFINSMKAGAPLPGHPQWASGSSDITTVRDLLNMPNTNGLFPFEKTPPAVYQRHTWPAWRHSSRWVAIFFSPPLSTYSIQKHPNPIADFRPAKRHQQRYVIREKRKNKRIKKSKTYSS